MISRLIRTIHSCKPVNWNNEATNGTNTFTAKIIAMIPAATASNTLVPVDKLLIQLVTASIVPKTSSLNSTYALIATTILCAMIMPHNPKPKAEAVSIAANSIPKPFTRFTNPVP